MKFLVIVVLMALTVAACGKKGPPSPAGPPDKIIYPRSYPNK